MLTLLTFRIRDTLFGVDISKVLEIDREVAFTAVPGAPDYVTGLFNMRGRVVVLYNIPRLFRYADPEEKQGSVCIVMESDGDAQGGEGFIIDQTGDVVHVAEDSVEPPPVNLRGAEARYIHGVVKLKDDIMLLLDCDRIFHMQNTASAKRNAS